MNRLIFFAALLLSLNAAAETSVPPLINYQGTLTDANGAPLGNASKKLEFNLYDQAGALAWGPQTFNNVPVINGQFNVILGTTDTAGRFIANAFTAQDRYLGIKVDGGAEITPRQRILSAPFAVQAEMLGGHNWADVEQRLTTLQSQIDAFEFSCYVTDWGEETACANLPEASPPACDSGYTFAGIAAETHSDGGCGHSSINHQKVKSICCKIK